MRSDSIDEINDINLGGWISPNGLFFRAHYEEHDDVADSILRDFLKAPYSYNASGWLIKRGWIRLETNGYIHHGFEATGQQFDVLYQLYARPNTEWYEGCLYAYIAPALLGSTREPMPHVPSQGDQENLRRSRGVYA